MSSLRASHRLSVLLLAVSGLGVGCTGTKTTGDGCATAADCQGGFLCVSGNCREVCNQPTDCTDERTRCQDGVCLPVNGAECATAADCGTPNACELSSGATCVDGVCKYIVRACTTPPADACVSGDTRFRAYGKPGTCAPDRGECDYRTFEVDCPSCATTCLANCERLTCDETANGCLTSGHCAPGPPPVCDYVPEADGKPCDLPEAQAGSLGGVCLAGMCLVAGSSSCTTNRDCLFACLGGVCRPRSTAGFPCDAGDSQDCASPLTCVGAICRAADTTPCTANRECVGTCIANLCAPNSAAGASCDVGDHADCALGLYCIGGACLRAMGASCTANSDCEETCINGLCAPKAGTNGRCDAEETVDCAPAHTCVGIECLRNDGQTCTANTECAGTCVAGICAPDVPIGGECDESEDCLAATQATCTGGHCLLPNGKTCTSNGQCVTTCISSTCADLAALLGTCDNNDTADCTAGLTCSNLACRYPRPHSCTADSQCVDGACECIDATCGNRVCASMTCMCKYGAAGACTTNLATGVDDPQDCASAGLSCNAGKCRADNPGTCACTCAGAVPTTCLALVGTNSCGTGWGPTCNGGSCGYMYGCLTTVPACSCTVPL